jgi:hypothetical protein
MLMTLTFLQPHDKKQVWSLIAAICPHQCWGSIRTNVGDLSPNLTTWGWPPAPRLPPKYDFSSDEKPSFSSEKLLWHGSCA